MKKFLPVILVLVIVVAAFAVYYFFLRPTGEPAEPSQYEKLSESFYYVPGEYFVTNITGSTALAKTSVSLQLSKDETEFLDLNQSVVRNAIVKVLISHPEQEMRADNSISMLESEMANAVRSATGLETLEQIFISDFVIQ